MSYRGSDTGWHKVASDCLIRVFCCSKTQRLRYKTSQTSMLLSGMACSFGLNKQFAQWQSNSSTFYEKNFKENSLQFVAGSKLMAESDRSSQKCIQRRRK